MTTVAEPDDDGQLVFHDMPDSDFETVAECEPPQYDDKNDPHNGAFDEAGG